MQDEQFKQTSKFASLSKMWQEFKGYSIKKKAIIAIVFFMFFVTLVMALSGSFSESTKQPSQQGQKKSEQPSSEQTNTTSYTYKTQENTLARQIEQKVIEVLGEKSNLDKQRIVGIDVEKYKAVELQQFGYQANTDVVAVTVKINASENLTTNLQKGTMHDEAFKVFKNVFPLSPTMGDVLVWSYLPVKDKYGNIKDDVAITYSMARSLFEKINWNDLNHRELPNLLNSEAKTDWRNGYVELVKF